MDAIMKTKDLEITSLRMQLNQLTNDYKFKVKVCPVPAATQTGLDATLMQQLCSTPWRH
jgi:hypothetical protein